MGLSQRLGNNYSIDDETISHYLDWAKDRIATLKDLFHDDMMYLWQVPDVIKESVGITNQQIVQVVDIIEANVDDKSIMKALRKFSKEENIKFANLMKDLRML